MGALKQISFLGYDSLSNANNYIQYVKWVSRRSSSNTMYVVGIAETLL